VVEDSPVKRLAAVAALLLSATLAPGADASRVKVVANDSARRVDVTIDGKPFTSYIYPTTLKKPVLFPLRTAAGTVVTRGYPLEPRKGERVDHPHHVGLWFNHGDVNGLDFWNNSDAIAADRAPKMGTIVHRRVLEATSGADRGELLVWADWVDSEGHPLLHERTRFVFRGDKDARSVERVTQLTALDRRVVFRDNKEGVLGLRVARALEQPADKPEVFTDAAGRPTPVPVLDNTGVTGQYLSSEGLKGDAVWGTRGRWTLLSGIVESEKVTLAMLDHPSNPGYPTYWHARGYGLFAANPLGQKVFSEGKQELNLTVEAGHSVTFRHRLLILTGAAGADTIEREFRAFASGPS
jgi:Methane oxygenase PmoA